MRQIQIRLLALAAAAVLLFPTGGGSVTAWAKQNIKTRGDVAVEQVQVDVPLVNAYVYSQNTDLSKVDPGKVRATLAGQKLQVLSVEQQKKTKQGVFYAFLLDVSASIPQADLDAAKDAIEQVADDMRSQDQLAVITFGDKVKVISDGSQPVEDTIRKIRALKAKDQTTKFYSAMDKLIKVSQKVHDMRRVAVVVSDGIDDTDAGMSQGELEDILQQSGIAVYGMGIGKNKALSEKFGTFLRISGGELYPFTAATANAKLNSLIKRLSSVYRLSMEFDGKMPKGDTIKLSVKVAGAGSFSMMLDSSYWGEATASQKEESKAAAEKNSQKRTPSSQEVTTGEEEKEETLDKGAISRQKLMVTIAIPAVAFATLLGILLILLIRRKKALAEYYRANGVDYKSARETEKAIRRKRKH
ncbi:MAG: VWA domain-containing protein [Lachnospiraceae bacterium]|nr:VWA domain-containing protein [Lachnospiraceae bacterium]